MKAGWAIRPLGEIAELTGGGTPSKQRPDFWQGDIPWVSPKDMKSDVVSDSEDHITVDAIDGSATKRIPEGALLIVVRSGILSRTIPTALAGRELTINQDLKAIIAGDKVEPRFLAYYFRASEVHLLDKVTRGATVHKLDSPVIKSLPIPLPPLEEQQRIVAVLDEAFEGLARARAHVEANLQNARELFGSELASVCRTHAEQYGTVSLAELSDEITDGDHMPPPKAQEGVPFVTIKNIDKETHDIDFSDTFKVPESYYQELKDKRKPRAGDVLYTVTGSFGIPVLVQAEQRFCFQRHIGLIRPRPDVSPEWLYFVLVSPFVFEQADAGATGTAQRTVSLKLLRSMVVPSVPSMLQTEIAARFRGIHSEASRLAVCYQAKLQDLDDLRQSLLQKAFAGELT